MRSLVLRLFGEIAEERGNVSFGAVGIEIAIADSSIDICIYKCYYNLSQRLYRALTGMMEILKNAKSTESH
ncbi:MAG: hypothetical protein V7K21_03945 [Nostoc sp.]|uniref:hypothetical protein n=1 Tax=Nostoc sp. TaxID=1180 RepID=UPI002FF87921